MDSQVTTKHGDGGQSTALSGDAYSKAHPVMECVGTLDELRAQTALLRLRVFDECPHEAEARAEFLFWLLHTYFVVGAACSDPLNKHPEYHPARLAQVHLDKLEAEQARLEAVTPLRHAFIASASNTLAAQADLTCAVARRFERTFERLRESVPGFDAGVLPAFLNRLSDYLYILARYLEDGNHTVVDYGVLGRD